MILRFIRLELVTYKKPRTWSVKLHPSKFILLLWLIYLWKPLLILIRHYSTLKYIDLPRDFLPWRKHNPGLENERIIFGCRDGLNLNSLIKWTWSNQDASRPAMERIVCMHWALDPKAIFYLLFIFGLAVYPQIQTPLL